MLQITMCVALLGFCSEKSGTCQEKWRCEAKEGLKCVFGGLFESDLVTAEGTGRLELADFGASQRGGNTYSS